MEAKLPSRIYEALERAGPRIRQLNQVHAQLLVSGSNLKLSILTKFLIFACNAGSIGYTRRILYSITNPDSYLFSSLIKSCSKQHLSLDALLFYRHMITSLVPPSNYAFTAVLKSCAELSNSKTGRIIHGQTVICGYCFDRYVQAALISLYSKCRDLHIARKVFDEMPERTIVAWNSMISGYEQNGLANEAIELFYHMRELGVEFDTATLVAVLSACSQIGAVELGISVHELINERGLKLNVVIGTALINMYAVSGNLAKSKEVFDEMKERNVVTWTAMISCYARNGYGREAVDLFNLMRIEGPPPNRITFVAVLSACAHAGLVQQGRQALTIMTRDYGFAPETEHHVSMVDMLGRAGYVNEGFQYIKDMYPIEPSAAVWTALLGACKMHKNLDIGIQVADHLMDVEPENPGHYVLLSNVFALAGQMDKVEKVRNKMIRKGLKKQVGYSTIEVDGKMYLFSMGDKSHSETGLIYGFLDELMTKIGGCGYVAVPETVMHELEEEEREYAVRYHSEKLAVAYGMLKTVGGTGVIRIVKNLRMCEDCHLAMKFISGFSQREIVVRDKFRFHHFKSGSCSCGDYW
ncbi:pentatricopeptide repeat-containing protein At2g33760 [Impatiens glandulifera]|uniref:pentatricopeptide repeat-containing protein At2g33760 n=1 Tax=Impatiens glandulifera TaxID=253017 RepID=UPI001FB0B755|nr:pentatricopeptide repeat-containing protein At2g33760 [Impatiens glandulifera]